MPEAAQHVLVSVKGPCPQRSYAHHTGSHSMPDAVSAWLGKPLLARSVPGGEEISTLPVPSVGSRNKEGKNPIPTSTPVSSRCMSNTWNTRTAPFASVGHWGSRPRTQRRSAVGDQFNTDTQGLGRGDSAQELGRQARGGRPTPSPRREGWVVGVGPDTPRGVPEEWLRQSGPPGDL